MTDRIPLDDMTSDQLDQLHAELDRLTAELADYDERAEQQKLRAERAEEELRRYTEADSADAAAGSYALRAEGVEAKLRRIIDLYEQWVKAGAPPLGVSTSRWWDRRLVELHAAIHAPAEQPARTTPNNPPICELPHQTIAEEDTGDGHATHTTRHAHVHIRTWNGQHDPALAAWAGPAATWDGNQLVIRTGDGETRPEPGWSLVRWPDGEVIVASPWAVSQCYQPLPLAPAEENRLAQSGADIRDLIDTVLRTTPRTDCADWPAREAHGHGHRYDMRCALCAGDADALTDAVLAALGQKEQQP